MSVVLTEKVLDGRALLITLNRPEARNAVNGQVAREMAAVLDDLDADPTLVVGIIRGEGKGFSAGMDLKAFLEGDVPAVDDRGFGGFAQRGPRTPLIAAIEGFAVAGGLELSLLCDMRVAAEGATFGVFCRRFGVPLIDLGTVRLPRLIGHSRAMDLILTGRPVNANEALAIGLANRVAPAGEALAHAVALAKGIAAFPQTCMRNDRLSAIEQWDMDENAAIENETRRGLETLRSGETAAGASRFSEGAGRGGKFE